jgi:hypothetical protein
MTTRNKLYYPESHIITNLNTIGKEWMLEDGTEYIGFYHSYVDGTQMTGPVYHRTESKKLIKYVDTVHQPDNFTYSKLKKRAEFKTPHYAFTLPTLEDYQAGKVVRYFIQRRNKTSYEDIIEIDKDQFKLWANQKGGIDNSLYEGIALDWKLTGPLYDDTSSKDTVFGVYSTNQRMVLLKNREFVGLKNFITDYIELSVHSKYVDDNIKKLFV